MRFEIGTQIDEYRIEALIGVGSMTEVYRVWNYELRRYEALKTAQVMEENRELVIRILMPHRKGISLQHSCMLPIYLVSEVNAPVPFCAMELVEGGNLANLLHTQGAVPLEKALPILRQIASGLDFAHDHDLTHHNIKPTNILLKPDKDNLTVKIVDASFPMVFELKSGQRMKFDAIANMPEYMSPEQAGNGEPVNKYTDQYSLAITAYELLCGVVPFRRAEGGSPEWSLMSALIKHVSEEPLPPSQHNPALPPAVDVAILKALSKKAVDRFDSCGEFVGALQSDSGRRTLLADKIMGLFKRGQS